MKIINTLCLAAWAVAASCFGQSSAVPLGPLVFNKSYSAWGCTPTFLSTGQVNFAFKAGNWNGCRIKFATPQDWSGYDCLVTDLQNIGTETGNTVIQIEATVNGATQVKTGSQYMLPGEHYRLALPINADGKPYGMMFYPSFAAVIWVKPGGQTLDMHQVINYVIMQKSLSVGTTVQLNYCDLVKFSHSMSGLVDSYGQRSDASFLNKITADTDFAVKDTAEVADLAANPPEAGLDAYGGYAKIQLTATGRFHTQQLNNKWWLVTPLGHPFLTFGMNATLSDSDTVITNRSGLFQSLPDPASPAGAFYKTFTASDVLFGPTKSGQSYDFYKGNLYKKWGDSWYTTAVARAETRLQSWGLNTIGNSSDYQLMKDHKLPYITHCIVKGTYKTVSPGAAYWGPAPDPFDPNWATAVANTITSFAQLPAGDPYCLGWTIDNELSMIGTGEEGGRYGIAYGVLASDMTLPAKNVFVTDLQTKYGTIDALNASWGTAFASWTTITNPLTSGFVTSANRIADFQQFCLKFWRQYYSTVNAKLKAVDSGALYLGSRFGFQSTDAVQAAQENCDVLSFNIYYPSIDPAQYGFLNNLTKPAFISEFSMGAPDRGMYCGGIVQNQTQASRAQIFTGYVNQVVDNPNLVGCHWHQYVDEPLLGRRLDMENYAFGFLDVCDNPQTEMVAAARTVYKGAYLRRAGY